MILLATSPTLDEMRKAIVAFYCGTPMTLAPSGENAWNVVRQRDGKVLDGMRVVKKGRRFRFEGDA